MNKAQKCAWFNVILTLVMIALHGAAFLMIATMGYVPGTLNTIGFMKEHLLRKKKKFFGKRLGLMALVQPVQIVM